jgi:small subunit ribosomal protein S21
LQVLVRDNNIDQAMRVLKKKMQREGIFRELKRRRFSKSPPRGRCAKRPRQSGAAESSPENRRSVKA